jgi:Ca2+-binding EF-hand superfamily protein
MKTLTTLLAVLALGSFATSLNAQEKKKIDPEAAFKKKDANSDGKVSKEEFLKGAKDAAKSEAAFTAKDKDKDGFLTLEEFKAGGGKKKDAK